MRDVLSTMVKAVGDQAIALGAVDDRVTVLKRALARQFPDMADELKGQIETEQEQSRAHFYELQVVLARVREALATAPEAAELDGEMPRVAAKLRTRPAGKLNGSGRGSK